MPVRASRETAYILWTEEDAIFLGVWYMDEFVRDRPAAEQLDKALFIDSVGPRVLMHMALHFLNVGLSLTEALFRRLQGAKKPPEEPPALPDDGKTTFGEPFLPGKDGDAPSEPE